MYHGPPLNVEFLFMPGCCCAGPALRLLRQVLAQEQGEPHVRVRVIGAEEEAIRHHFHGSPTILINGVDIEGPSAVRHGYKLRCRSYYAHEKCPGVPDAALIRSGIHTHPGLGRPSGSGRLRNR